jgi:glycosyltransferase involved in cell wall biosynthesis
MTRVVVDITQLAHWQGNITGIPRVMHEYAVRFREDNPDAIFAVWVKEIREFCEINLEETLAHRGHGIAYLYDGQPSPASGGFGHKPISSTPQPVEKKLTLKRIARGGIVRTARVNKRLAATVERKARSLEVRRYKRVVFEKGDTIFIPWGEWWSRDFITKLEQCHQAGVRLVQILHDMSPIVVPQYSNSGNATETFPVYCRRILPIVDLVLSVSNNSKKDAIKWLSDNELHVPPIEVIRLGDDIKISRPRKPGDEPFTKNELTDNFILFVGTVELKKNHMLMYYVYKLARAQGIELPKLVIAGRRGWMTEATFELMTKDPEVSDMFVFLLDRDDEELSWLYNHALFSVLPSFYEGWGIPIAESVARGVPCLCSNTSSMTEVAEGYVEHFTPYSSEDCLRGMRRWLEKPATLEAAREHTRQYKQFTWDQSFDQVKQYMKEIL